MKDKLLQEFWAAWHGIPLYTGDYLDKKAFHAVARKFARQVARDLDLPKGSFTVRTNMAGDGVGGDTTLHAETFYLNFCTENPGFLEVLYRTCAGRKDYGGGLNQWTTYQKVVAQYPDFLADLRKCGGLL